MLACKERKSLRREKDQFRGACYDLSLSTYICQLDREDQLQNGGVKGRKEKRGRIDRYIDREVDITTIICPSPPLSVSWFPPLFFLVSLVFGLHRKETPRTDEERARTSSSPGSPAR